MWCPHFGLNFIANLFAHWEGPSPNDVEGSRWLLRSFHGLLDIGYRKWPFVEVEVEAQRRNIGHNAALIYSISSCNFGLP